MVAVMNLVFLQYCEDTCKFEEVHSILLTTDNFLCGIFFLLRYIFKTCWRTSSLIFDPFLFMAVLHLFYQKGGSTYIICSKEFISTNYIMLWLPW